MKRKSAISLSPIVVMFFAILGGVFGTLEFTSSAFAAARPYDFYGEELKLGNSEQVVVAQLRKDGLILNTAGSPEEGRTTYLVLRPSLIAGGSVTSLGALSFEKGKLVRASKNWFSGSGSSMEFSRAFHKAFATVSVGILTSCGMIQGADSTPELDSTKTSFVCGDRTIEVVTVSMKSPPFETTQINEVLTEY